MSNLDKGFIILPRSFFGSSAWVEHRNFSKAECWIDLISMSKFELCSQVIGFKSIKLNRGESIASIRFLSNRWNYSIGKVQRMMDFWEKEGQIERKTIHNITIVKVLNYDKYQNLKNYLDTPSDTKTIQHRYTSDTNIKNYKTLKTLNNTDTTQEKKFLVGVSEDLIKEWKEFLKHRRKIKAPISTLKSEERIFGQLKTLSNGSTKNAIAIIQQSIDKSWRGLFEIKEKESKGNKAPWEIAEEEQLKKKRAAEEKLKQFYNNQKK